MTEARGIPGPGLARWRTLPHAGPWLPVLCGAVPVAIALVGAWLQAANGQGPLGLALLPHVVALSAGGAALLRVRSARPVAITLSAGALPWAFAALATGLLFQWAPTTNPFENEPTGFGLLFLLLQEFFVLLTPVTPMALFHLFPTGLVARPWARAILVASLVAPTLAVAAVCFYPLATGNDESWVAWESYLFALTATYLAGAGLLVMRFVASPTPVRRQIAAFGVVQVCFTAALLTAFSSSWSDATFAIFQAAWVVGILGSIAYGVARHRLYDLRMVVRRVFIYALTTIVLTIVFVGIYVLLSAVLTEGLSTGTPYGVPAAAAVVVVLLLEPVRRRILTRLENRYLGDRRRSLQTLARLNTERSDDPDSTYQRIVEAVVTAVRAPAAGLALNDGGRNHTVAARGTLGHEPLAVPMQYRGELLGQISVARRTAKEEYTAADLSLLEQLAGQAAAHIFAVRRDQELSQSRREALTAIAEERAKLGRDLHDGLAPLLAGAGLSAEALRLDLTPNSTAEQEAAQLALRLQHASGEVRRIAHGLDPGELSQSLDEAVGSYLEGLRGPGLPAFSAHLDVDKIPRVLAHAAYMVALEAIHNVVGHAAAQHAEVTMRTERDHLILRVDDDGCGIPQPYVSGFGITSMRRRVEALDGLFTIIARPTGGTRIQALIPIPK